MIARAWIVVLAATGIWSTHLGWFGEVGSDRSIPLFAVHIGRSQLIELCLLLPGVVALVSLVLQPNDRPNVSFAAAAWGAATAGIALLLVLISLDKPPRTNIVVGAPLAVLSTLGVVVASLFFAAWLRPRRPDART
jgi:hypothetical protein